MGKISTDKKRIERFLTRSVENVYPSKKLVKNMLESGKSLRVYYGIDPTGPTLHLGHMITMKKLAELQELGHEIILLIGDFTATIGDPTDKMAVRKKLTKEEVLENAKRYKKQASKVLRFTGENSVKLKYNSVWLGKMTFADVVDLASHFTVQQIMERDMFEKRYRGEIICPNCKTRFVSPIKITFHEPTPKDEEEGTGIAYIDATIKEVSCVSCGKKMEQYIKNKGNRVEFFNKYIIKPKPIYLHEFLYPLMQGKDSVAMNVDGEIGGNDQTFNMLAGRTLQKQINKKEKFVITNTLLVDPSGKKMGKSEGNMIAMTDSAKDMFGKIMSWQDEMIAQGFRLCTDKEEKEITDIEKAMRSGKNPMQFKKALARDIVTWLIGKKDAEEAEKYFGTVFQNHHEPDEMEEVKLGARISLINALCQSGLASSKSDARRLIQQGAVKINGEVMKDDKKELSIKKEGLILQKGKRHFRKILP